MGKIGLALGGGAVLGAAHVGVLRAIEEHGLEVSYISGTSIGAFVGAFYAFGMAPDEIEKIALKLKWMDISRLSFSGNGLLSNKKLGELVVDHIGECSFEESKIPLSMIATDAASGDKVVLNEGSISDAVIGISIAKGLVLSIDPFLMAIAIGASASFLTPIGHQSNTLVMGPRGYRFGDYFRMGLPMSILVVVLSIPLILYFWPV